MKDTTKAARMILEIVRGERPLKDLRAAGIIVMLRGDKYEMENPDQVVATVSAADVARGLLAYSARPTEIGAWASTLVAGSSFLDWPELETHPDGDLLLDALWDASFSKPVAREALEAARRIAAQ